MAVVVVGNAYLLEYLCNYSRTMWLASRLDGLTSHSTAFTQRSLARPSFRGCILGRSFIRRPGLSFYSTLIHSFQLQRLANKETSISLLSLPLLTNLSSIRSLSLNQIS